MCSVLNYNKAHYCKHRHIVSNMEWAFISFFLCLVGHSLPIVYSLIWELLQALKIIFLHFTHKHRVTEVDIKATRHLQSRWKWICRLCNKQRRFHQISVETSEAVSLYFRAMRRGGGGALRALLHNDYVIWYSLAILAHRFFSIFLSLKAHSALRCLYLWI